MNDNEDEEETYEYDDNVPPEVDLDKLLETVEGMTRVSSRSLQESRYAGEER